MADKKSKKKAMLGEKLIPKVSVPKLNIQSLKISRVNFKKILALHNLSSLLAIIYYLIWIPVGLFLFWFIVANFRAGVFDQLLHPQKQSAQTQQTGTDQPTETTVPGVGRVNIACVQNAISEDAIVKMVQEKGTKSLTDDERQKLDPCILEKDTSTPIPSASSSPKN